MLSTDAYDAYGARNSTATGAQPDPFGYHGEQGYYTDVETGLQLCGHRFYDSAVGRFLNRDPLNYAGGLNLYAYAGNNPVSAVDPSGFNPCKDGGDSSESFIDWGTSQFNSGAENAKDYYNNSLARVPGGWVVAGTLNTGITFVQGLADLPHAINHLGEASGCYAGNPSRNSVMGVVKDTVTVVAVVSPAIAPALAPEAGSLDAATDGAVDAASLTRRIPCAGKCLPAGTLVWLADGTTEAIEDVRPGDVVSSRDPSTGRDEAREVTATVSRPSDALVTLSLSEASGKAASPLVCTPEHPLWVAGRSWAEAGSLSVGDRVLARDGR